MPLPQPLSVAGAGLVLISAALVACSSSPSSDAPHPPATGSSATSLAPTTKTHLTSYATGDGATSDVVLSGAIGDYGTATRDSSDRQLELRLKHGGFALAIAGLETKRKAATANLVVNQRSCSAELSIRGSATVVSGSGTGNYTNLRGTFVLTMTLDEVYQPGACAESDPYQAQVIILSGWGTVVAS